MNKNDIINLEITDLTGGGDGIGHAEDGRVVFVPNTAIGDVAEVLIIKVKSKYALGKVKSIKKAAKNRIESDCNISNKCGGCVFRHISYESECEIKYNQVKNSIQRIGGIDLEPENIVCAEKCNHYRNKAQYPIGTNRLGEIICGFYAKSSHRIVEGEACKLQPEIFDKIVENFCYWANDYKLTAYDEKNKKGLLRHLYIRYAEVTGQIMVVIVINGDDIPYKEKLIERLKSICGENLVSVQLNINKMDTNVVLGEKCKTIYGDDYIYDVLCSVKIRLSPMSFYQVNRLMAEKLYNLASKFAEPENKFILDLYCGAGTIGLSMANKAKKIIGVEIVPEAIRDAVFNAKNNNINNAEFICGDAAKAVETLRSRNIKPDVVILDPPRKGCDSDLLNIVANDFCPERIVYISCNDATFARDCKILEEIDYKLIKAVPVDLFAKTGHVETVGLIKRV